ncbi:MAG TPA: TetR family transcriptional regulator C-terminal domain-containing protein [Gammaproteobacteria bacterium]|nr:TetR family transcriptional regulator C-terminal domain-containing protein [Gammaproteobacteria bacterium]
MAENSAVKQTFSRKSAFDRRADLIAAGIVCLGEGGMEGFTVDKICKQAGISRGLINHHFNTKDELLSCIYAHMTDHLVQEDDGGHATEFLARIIEVSFDEASFNRSNLRAWLSIWGQVSSNHTLNELHKQRYHRYRESIKSVLMRVSATTTLQADADSVARQLIALIDGLWLEYCLHSDSFSLAAARTDCYQFLAAYGVTLGLPVNVVPEV